MATMGVPLLERCNAKGREDDPEFSQWRVAIDAYRQMVDFLGLTPECMTFTEDDREAIRRDLKRLSLCCGQMDAGQRGRGVNYDEVPHIMARIAVAAMRMELSGALDRLEVDE